MAGPRREVAVVSSSIMRGQRDNAYGAPHSISVVIPVFQGEKTLGPLLAEIEPLTKRGWSPERHPFLVSEIIVVFDHGPDDSARVIRELADRSSLVKPIWLTRNFGQHAGTLAGMAASSGDWIVTLDEDGQHDPRDIGAFLDAAMREQCAVVYAKPTNAAPHGFLRNAASRGSKWLLTKLLSSREALEYHSYRLVLGSVGRSVAEHSGAGVYLDVAIGWVAGRATTVPVLLRGNTRASGYSTRSLLAHFRRMLLTSGTRGLRFVSGLGVTFAIVGLAIAIYLIIARLRGSITTQGWASMIVVVLVSSGAVLVALGIIAEYIGVSVNMALGKPRYVTTSDPASGPLGRSRPPEE